MRTRQEAVDACLTLAGVFEDYPFDDPNWTVMRHGGAGKKSFAYIYERQGLIWINVKAEPLAVTLWQQIFPAVRPAYHMNKEHWVSIALDGTMADEEILRLIGDSYRLTRPKAAQKKPRTGEA